MSLLVITGAVLIVEAQGDISISESAFKGNSVLGNEEEVPAEGGGMIRFNLIVI